MAISDWPDDQRPRERLLAQGAAALSDAELLAIFLRVGVKGMSAVDLARTLLAHFDNSLSRLFRDVLGKTNQEIARAADEVFFLVAGIPLQLKGKPVSP